MTATFPSLQPNAKSALVSVVEDHLNHIIQRAVSVSRKCKRARINVSNSNSHNNNSHTRLHASDIHLALQLNGSPRLFGYSDYVISGETKESDVVHLKDMMISSAEINYLEPPNDIAAHHTWLAIEGEPTDATIVTTSPSVAPTIALDDTTTSTLQIDRKIQSGILSDELILYYQRITTGLEDSVIGDLAHTSGIQELIPFLVRFALQTSYEALSSDTSKEDTVRTMIRILNSLLLNVQLHMDWQLHEIIPALLNICVIELSHYERCKLDAAYTLSAIVRLYGGTYPTIAPRITATLGKAMIAPIHDETSHGRVYGGLVGLTALGMIGGFSDTIAQSWETWNAECQQVALTAAVRSLPVREVLGDRCVSYDTTSSNGYAHCFV